ncbi:conserved hypothetical protein [Citreicella sp. SE45]|nr:conserved hypothetical protein [Citreicella sp. SE45]
MGHRAGVQPDMPHFEQLADAVGEDASLAAVAKLRGHRSLERRDEIGVIEDDEGCVSAKLWRHLFERRGALLGTQRPTRVLQVKLGLRITGEAVSAPPMTSGRPVSTLNTPAGMSARSSRMQSASAEHGVKSDGLIAIVPPSARPVTEAAGQERPG